MTTTSCRYASAPIRARSFGAKQAIVENLRTGLITVLPLASVQLLNQCRCLNTISELQGKAVRVGCGESTTQVAAIIENLVMAGLLLAEADILKPLPGESQRVSGRIEEIIICTSDRPAHLRNLLDSMWCYVRATDRHFHLTVLDDSREPRAREENVGILRDVGRQGLAGIVYVDRGRRAGCVDQLIRRSGLPLSAIEGLLGTTDGKRRSEAANRNVGLLRTLGHRAITFDDDLVLRWAVPKLDGCRARFSSKLYPMTTRFYADMDEALQQQPVETHGIIELYEAYLGMAFRDLTVEDFLFENAHCSSDLWNLVIERAGVIKLALPGLLGDCGRSSRRWMLSELAKKCMESDMPLDQYTVAAHSRIVYSAPDSLTVSDSPFCMAYALGIDNTDVLPPFLPIGRTCDGLFGRMVKSIYSNSATAYLPGAIQHLSPTEPRVPREKIWIDASVVKESDLLYAFLRGCSFSSSESPKIRLADVGKQFARIGESSENTFAHLVKACFWQELAARLSAYETLLDQCSYNRNPASVDLENAVRLLREQPTKSPLTLSDGDDDYVLDRRGMAAFQARVRNYGECVLAWPSLLDFTSSMGTDVFSATCLSTT